MARHIHIHIHQPSKTRDQVGASVSPLVDLLFDLIHKRGASAGTSDAAGEFEESKHPRDGDGKFSSSGGGGGGGESSTKPMTNPGKGSIKANMHSLLSSGHPFSVQELMQVTGVKSESLMKAYLTDLKNPKYAGRLGSLQVVKRADGMYHVQKSAAPASAPAPAPAQEKSKSGVEALIEKANDKGIVKASEVFHHAFDEPPLGKSRPGFKEHEEEVSLSDIVPTQETLHTSGLLKYAGASSFKHEKTGQPPEVIKKDGKYYLLDGHHRIASAIANGHSGIKALVVGDQTKATPAPAQKPAPAPAGKASQKELVDRLHQALQKSAKMPGGKIISPEVLQKAAEYMAGKSAVNIEKMTEALGIPDGPAIHLNNVRKEFFKSQGAAAPLSSAQKIDKYLSKKHVGLGWKSK